MTVVTGQHRFLLRQIFLAVRALSPPCLSFFSSDCDCCWGFFIGIRRLVPFGLSPFLRICYEFVFSFSLFCMVRVLFCFSFVLVESHTSGICAFLKIPFLEPCNPHPLISTFLLFRHVFLTGTPSLCLRVAGLSRPLLFMMTAFHG